MNAEKIILTGTKQQYEVPNRWELLTPKQYLLLIHLLGLYSSKQATIHDVKFYYLCNALRINPKKIKDPGAMANMIVIADQIDFIFDSKGKVNIAFIAQLVPFLKVNNKRYKGYKINTSFETLTCSLTASQFIDAQEVLTDKTDKLPLLAAILYSPAPYSSEKAHDLAHKFSSVSPMILQAIAFNFQAFVTFIFTRTHFSILSSREKADSIPEIATGLAETMYNLSTDGLGDAHTVKQMPVIEFLIILRKKLIESVRAMHDSKIEITEIADKTGLSTKTIKRMI